MSLWWRIYEVVEWRLGRVACALGRCNVTCRGRVECARKIKSGTPQP